MAARPIAHSVGETKAALKQQGFVDIDHQHVGLPSHLWHHDKHEKEVGRWYHLAISESVEVLSLAPFHHCFRSSLEQIQILTRGVKREISIREMRAYNILHIYQARKPNRPH